jgi:predicted  nucleic acid-binding Zn-ribbon protein
MLSNNLEFKKLLLLHGKDRRKLSMESELKNLPDSIKIIDSKIEIENATIESASHELREVELLSNSLEKEIHSLTDLIDRQKNKQLEVKKNEEYQALENEIHNLVQQLSQKEDQQIETLLKIDGAKKPQKLLKIKFPQS